MTRGRPPPAQAVLGFFAARKHGFAAVFRTAVAGGFGWIAVVEVVVVGQLFAGSDISQGENPDAFARLFCFAVGVAGMVEEHGSTVAVDDLLSIADAEEVGHGQGFVFDVGGLLGHTGAGVFDDARTLGNGSRGVAACGMDCGGANDETHTASSIGDPGNACGGYGELARVGEAPGGNPASKLGNDGAADGQGAAMAAEKDEA